MCAGGGLSVQLASAAMRLARVDQTLEECEAHLAATGSFGTPIEIERAGQKPATTTLYDLAGEGRVEVDASFNSIQVTAHSNGSRTIAIRNR